MEGETDREPDAGVAVAITLLVKPVLKHATFPTMRVEIDGESISLWRDDELLTSGDLAVCSALKVLARLDIDEETPS